MANAIPTKVDAARKKIIDSVPLNKYLLDKRYLSYEKDEGKICCPVHDENSPSFFFDSEKGVYHCFGCGSKGSIVELHTAVEKKTDEKANTIKAILHLAKKYNVEVPNMFEYDDIMKPKRRRHKKFDLNKQLSKNEDTVYNRKLERLEEQAKALSVVDRLKVYKIVDAVQLEDMTPKEAYSKVSKFMESKRSKDVV